MSVFKDLSESHDFIKAIATTAFLLPFWYVAIYLFNNEFYLMADTVIIVSMCIVLTLISTVSFVLVFLHINSKVKDGTDLCGAMIISVTLLIAWLSMLIIVFYSILFFFNISLYFYWFLVIYSIPILLFFIVAFLIKD